MERWCLGRGGGAGGGRGHLRCEYPPLARARQSGIWRDAERGELCGGGSLERVHAPPRLATLGSGDEHPVASCSLALARRRRRRRLVGEALQLPADRESGRRLVQADEVGDEFGAFESRARRRAVGGRRPVGASNEVMLIFFILKQILVERRFAEELRNESNQK